MNKGADMAISPPLKNDTNLKAALSYVRLLGFSILPTHSIVNGKCTCRNHNCSNAGKHPATRNGVKDATKNEKQIIQWWSENPHYNIGIATGKKSNIFVLDIDVNLHKGTGMTGFEALEELENKYGELPHTPMQITGSGGIHYIFRYENGIKNRTNVFPSIDTRSDNGYIIATPSIHENGNKYQWELSSHPLKIDIAEAPSWLINLLVDKHSNNKYRQIPINEYIRILQGVSEGERNNSLMTLIGHLINKLDYREAFEIIHIWNETRVEPPLDPTIVTTAFNNILRKEAKKRGDSC